MIPFMIGIIIFLIVSVSCYFVFRNKKTTTKPPNPPNPPNPPVPTNCNCNDNYDCKINYNCINSKCVLHCPNNCNKVDECSGETCICPSQKFKCDASTNYICQKDDSGPLTSCLNPTCCPENMILSEGKCYYYNPAQSDKNPTYNYPTPQTNFNWTNCIDRNVLQENTTNIPYNVYYCVSNSGSSVCDDITSYDTGTYVQCTNPSGCNITNFWNNVSGPFNNPIYGYCPTVS